MSAFPIYHLLIEAEGCVATVRINGFPLYTLECSRPRQVAPPINPMLSGAGNELEVEIHAVMVGGKPSRFDSVRVSGSVRRFTKDDMVEPTGGAPIVSFGVPEELALRHAKGEDVPLPFTIRRTFDNDGPSFRELLLESTPYADAAALVDYALEVKAIFRARDVGGIDRELGPKIAAYAAAYDVSPGQMRAEFLDVVASEILPSELVDFERGQISLAPCCGGRLWELMRDRGKPLIETVPAEPSASSFLSVRVFAAPIDGQLRIVR